jgi:acetyl esterase/lipase
VYKLSSTPPNSRLPVFFFFHGGGYCFGTLSSEDGFCSWVVEKVGIIVINVCYRHTPDWNWPAQQDDASNALNWVFDNLEMIGGNRETVVVGGRSSGSNLAAGAALRDKDAVSGFNGQERLSLIEK